MRAVRIKLVILFLALAFSGAAVLFAYHYLSRQWIPEKQAIVEIEEYYEAPPRPPPDPAVKQFAKAVELLRSGEEAAARAELMQIMEIYPDSTRTPLAKRLIGELNLDRLLSRRPMPGKLDYLVKRGDALAAIARNHRTTLAYLRLVNGVSSYNIHPGDRFVLYPVEFEVLINTGEQVLTLLQEGVFFAEFPIAEVVVPNGLRVPTKKGDVPTKIVRQQYGAWEGEKKIGFSDPGYGTAAKWVPSASVSGRP